MIGAGKYNHYATLTRTGTGAKAAIVIVVDGRYGSGFAVQGGPDIMGHLPMILRDMAEQIETDLNTPSIVKEEGAG